VLPRIFHQETTHHLTQRINRLEGSLLPIWGEMNVG